MKTIGLICGLSWVSTIKYYERLNAMANAKSKENQFIEILLYSFDFSEIQELQEKNDWEKIEKKVLKAAEILENGGANFILICSNTIHKIANSIEKNINIPLINIIDVTGNAIVNMGLKKVGLLGTEFTMQEPFYKERLRKKFDIEIEIPNQKDITILNNIIFKLRKAIKEGHYIKAKSKVKGQKSKV